MNGDSEAKIRHAARRQGMAVCVLDSLGAVAAGLLVCHFTGVQNTAAWVTTGIFAAVGGFLVGIAAHMIQITQFLKPSIIIINLLNAITHGNLNYDIQAYNFGVLSPTKQAFVRMSAGIRRLISTVIESCQAIGSSITVLESGVQNVKEHAVEVTSLIKDVEEAVLNQDQAVIQIHDLIIKAGPLVTKMETEADHTVNHVKAALEIIQSEIKTYDDQKERISSSRFKIEKMNSAISDLQVKTEEIVQIMGMIASIAGQTNLLALNASIEAARSGEIGSGFIVVAEEVRKLSEQSNAAAREIGMLLAGVQSSINEAAEGMKIARTAARELETALYNNGRVISEVDDNLKETSLEIQLTMGSIQEILAVINQLFDLVSEMQRASCEMTTKTCSIQNLVDGQSHLINSLFGVTNEFGDLYTRLNDQAAKFQVTSAADYDDVSKDWSLGADNLKRIVKSYTIKSMLFDVGAATAFGPILVMVNRYLFGVMTGPHDMIIAASFAFGTGVILGLVTVMLDVKGFIDPTMVLITHAKEVTKGNLTQGIDVNANIGNLSGVRDVFNAMIDQLRNTVLGMKDLSEKINVSAGQAAVLAADTARNARVLPEELDEITGYTGKQAEQMQITHELTERLKKMVDSIEKNTESVNNSTMLSSDMLEKALAAANYQKEKVVESRATFSRVVTITAELDEKSSAIGQIIKVIRDISSETNLLALNAAVEAARAGDMGRGFAVVAEEIRKLAEETSQAAERIYDLMDEIQVGSKRVVEDTIAAEEVLQSQAQEVLRSEDALEQISARVIPIRQDIQDLAKLARVITESADAIFYETKLVLEAGQRSESASRKVLDYSEKQAQIIDQVKDLMEPIVKSFAQLAERLDRETTQYRVQ
ncbi:MAG: methyl-accepting chemotaxis protein, partial [Candidatus Saccharibacteria bacterium]